MHMELIPDNQGMTIRSLPRELFVGFSLENPQSPGSPSDDSPQIGFYK